ncbi:Serine-threonine protein kinase [Halorhabdus tiamatea SARL4B]|uniref:Serine-threonine protein kinase n=1 Tax=Halorhabdus tiamatea SARL4B TaxID=1033806 RepID=F7PH28_9EURY|nr:protein kinase [Halorhabdus tiamatea]ERJ05667.1 Serine-threonine protein kinase [Halorhabdus tiamatea SARL4B]CCQ32445.1 serine/threonine protein kinase [Halorhabdus tiamatea SARL4B]
MADVDDGRDPFETVQAVMADPAASTDRLPSLLGLLDDDDPTVRLAGAFALCLVAVADPGSITYVRDRLSDRLETGNAEARLTLEYIARRFPDRVEAEFASDSKVSREGTGAPGGERGRDSRVEDVGRVRPPRAGFDPRSVDPNRSVIDPADPQRHDDPAQGPSGGSSPPEGTVPEELKRSETNIAERRQWNRLFERLSEIVAYSRFEELRMLSGQQRGRYADVARVLTVDEGVERALAMRLFYRPSAADSDSLLESLATALDRWQGISDHPGIATVYDWNQAPQPWAATDLLETTVADRVEALAPSRAVSIAIDVADALAYAHTHGVVHGGLDPRNVGLPALGERGDADTATLVNVGLLEVYRYHVSPASCLDPRYAAPEYYDRQFGKIDHATDIYHLGAVLYRLLTGRPPFLGEFEAVREDVLNAAPPQPSLQVDVPDALDNVVSKALAKRSLGRYETINDLRQDLTRVHAELTDHNESRGSDRP